jgi:hypothetical protein
MPPMPSGDDKSPVSDKTLRALIALVVLAIAAVAASYFWLLR